MNPTRVSNSLLIRIPEIPCRPVPVMPAQGPLCSFAAPAPWAIGLQLPELASIVSLVCNTCTRTYQDLSLIKTSRLKTASGSYGDERVSTSTSMPSSRQRIRVPGFWIR